VDGRYVWTLPVFGQAGQLFGKRTNRFLVFAFRKSLHPFRVGNQRFEGGFVAGGELLLQLVILAFDAAHERLDAVLLTAGLLCDCRGKGIPQFLGGQAGLQVGQRIELLHLPGTVEQGIAFPIINRQILQHKPRQLFHPGGGIGGRGKALFQYIQQSRAHPGMHFINFLADLPHQPGMQEVRNGDAVDRPGLASFIGVLLKIEPQLIQQVGGEQHGESRMAGQEHMAFAIAQLPEPGHEVLELEEGVLFRLQNGLYVLYIVHFFMVILCASIWLCVLTNHIGTVGAHRLLSSIDDFVFAAQHLDCFGVALAVAGVHRYDVG
jgi:hypothetical protein